MVDKYVCDICDKEFEEEDMSSLGGDVFQEGYAPSAVPAECISCHEDWWFGSTRSNR